MQLGHERVNLLSHSRAPRFAEQIDRHRTVPATNFSPGPLITLTSFFRQTSTVKKLIGDALKRGNDHDKRLPLRPLQDNPADVADTTGCGE